MPQTSPHPSANSESNEDAKFMKEQFGAVLAQLKVDSIASLALSVRQNISMGARDSREQRDAPRPTEAPVIGCKVNSEPLRGSYNLAYRVKFDDGVEWILKVPANGSHDRFDQLAADSMTSEAFTMKMIKRTTTIPVPTIHSFDASSENEIGCPYILMDFLKGRPLYEGWFNTKASSVKREQFRARALQSIAAAMVQLNVFTTHRGGALRFNSAGEAVDVVGAKMWDVKTYQDRADEGSVPDGDIWCQNISTTDPSSYFLFMLNRLGNKEGDDAYSRGVRESIRIFTKWALELSDNAHPSEGKFVLFHPDLDYQNILVHDDGTLSGILDWDGVAAVPLSVGCLRFPSWLMRSPKENAPDELGCYRAMYAQFVEALLPFEQANGQTGMMGPDITRMSLITGALESAVNFPEDTHSVAEHFYWEIKRVVGDKDDSDFSDSESLESDGQDVVSDPCASGESSADSLLSRSEAERTDSGEETERTEVEEPSSEALVTSKETHRRRLCQVRIEDMRESSPVTIDSWKDGKYFSAPDVISRKEPGIEQDSDLALSPSSHDIATEAGHDQRAPTPQEDEPGKWVLELGAKGCKSMAQRLHPKEAAEVKPSRKVGLVKWVLALGEKGCKQASKALHKQDGASDQQMKGRTASASVRNDSSTYSRTGKVVIRLCNQAEILLRNIVARMHRDKNESASLETETMRAPIFLRSLIGMLKNMMRMLLGNGVAEVETPATAKEQLPQKTDPVDQAHYQRCNSGDVSPGPETVDQKRESAKIDSKDVWACIAADVDMAGISIDMIKEHRVAIAQYVIEKLEREIGREKQGGLRLENMKAAQKAKETTIQTMMSNTDPLSNPGPIQHPCLDDSTPVKLASSRTPMAERDATPLRVSEGRVVDMVEGKSEIPNPLVAPSLPGVKGVLSQAIKKPELGTPVPEDAICLRIWTVATGGANVETFHPYQQINDFGSSESESLLSKLEAAKQRFDAKMALKGQKCGSRSTGPVNEGAKASQVGYVEQKTWARDLSTSESSEKANQELRMILKSLAKPSVASSSLTSLTSTSLPAAEDDGATTTQLGIPKSRTSKRVAILSGDIHQANQKLKRCLSSLQEPIAFDANLQPSICQTAEGDDEEPESVAAQCQKTVKGGRWFETPRGSLKRIEDEQKVNVHVNGQEAVAEPSNLSSSVNSPEISVVSDKDQGQEMAGDSEFQLLFPNPNQSESVNHFQVPDIDEDTSSDEEEYHVETFAQKDNGEEDDELEEGELREGGVRLNIMAQGAAQGNTENRISASREASQDSGPKKTVDHGNFNMEEVCIALGNGKLDPQRMRRLKAGFKMMIAEALGEYRWTFEGVLYYTSSTF